jgi:hypothetical protein
VGVEGSEGELVSLGGLLGCEGGAGEDPTDGAGDGGGAGPLAALNSAPVPRPATTLLTQSSWPSRAATMPLSIPA